MRSSVQPVSSSRSLALQQYDEAKTLGTTAGTGSSTAAATRSRAASASPRMVLQQDHDDDWGLCGWQEGPSVPHEARVTSAKLSKHQPALPPAQQQPSTSQNTNSSDRTSSGGSRRATPAGKGSSLSRRPAQGSPAVVRSRPLQQQQQHPAAGELPLAGWAPLGAHDAAAEHCRTSAGADIAATETAGTTLAGAEAAAGAGAAAGACGSTSGGSSRATSAGSNQSGTSTSTGSGSTTSSSSAWHLPSIQHNHQQQACPLAAHGTTSFSTTAQADEACTIRSALATGFEQPIADAAQSDECGVPSDYDDALFGACGTSSRGVMGWQTPSTSLSSSNILALQQRLLLPACASSLARTSGGGSSGGLLAASRQSATGATAQPAAGPRISASGSMGVMMRGAGPTALQAAPAAPGFCLHTRMATTAARAQLLLTRDLSTVLTPHAPRVRPGSRQEGADSSAAAGDDGSRETEQQPWEQQPQRQQQQLGGTIDVVPTLRSVSSSRPSSASRCGRAAAAATSSPTYTATSAPGAPSCVFSGSGLNTTAAPSAASDCTLCSPEARTGSSSGSGSVAGSRPASGRRRPGSVSLGSAARWGSGAGSDSGVGSSRPGSTGVPVLGPSTTGAGVRSPQSKGLSAAADYMACRATVGELLQRINSQKAAASASVQQLAWTVTTPPKAALPGVTRASTPAAAHAGLASHDTVFSRDSRLSGSPQITCRTPGEKGVTSSQLLGLRTQPGLSAVERCTSLKAYQAFQSGMAAAGGSSIVGSSVHDSGCGGVGSSSGIGSWPCLHKSISSGPSIRAGARTATLELRATAALRKCGSTKQ